MPSLSISKDFFNAILPFFSFNWHLKPVPRITATHANCSLAGTLESSLALRFDIHTSAVSLSSQNDGSCNSILIDIWFFLFAPACFCLFSSPPVFMQKTFSSPWLFALSIVACRTQKVSEDPFSSPWCRSLLFHLFFLFLFSLCVS